MEKFIFTFKDKHPLRDYVQPVFEKDQKEARAKMFEKYGNEWCFQWTGSQWEEWVKDRHEMNLSVPGELNPIYCREEK